MRTFGILATKFRCGEEVAKFREKQSLGLVSLHLSVSPGCTIGKLVSRKKEEVSEGIFRSKL